MGGCCLTCFARQIERAKKLLANLDPETYKKEPYDVTRFIKRTSFTKTGEKATDTYEINERIIEEEERYDGFYAVATNLDDRVKAILAISSNRYKIEYCFRITKTNLSARPVYYQKPRRIIAHFIICYMSMYDNSQICIALNAIFDLCLDKKYYRPKELNKKIQSRFSIQYFRSTKKWYNPSN